eukprot:7655031-Pyramimonas_sp.AAC.1
MWGGEPLEALTHLGGGPIPGWRVTGDHVPRATETHGAPREEGDRFVLCPSEDLHISSATSAFRPIC